MRGRGVSQMGKNPTFSWFCLKWERPNHQKILLVLSRQYLHCMCFIDMHTVPGDRPLKLGKNCDFLNKSFPCKGLALCLLHTWTGAVTRTKDDEDNNEKLTILKGVADQPWFGFPLWLRTIGVGDLLQLGSDWEGEIFGSKVRMFMLRIVEQQSDFLGKWWRNKGRTYLWQR